MKSLTGKRLAVVLPLFLLLGAAVPIGCKKEPVSGTVPRSAENGVSEQPAETNPQPAESDVPQQTAGDAQKEKPLLPDDIRKLAEDGDEAAQLAWGEALLNTGTTQDEKAEGVEWIRKAAEHEDYTPAHYSLGMCYAEGNGVERDDAEAFKWFQKGAAEGQFVSLYQLALCHIDGRGTEI